MSAPTLDKAEAIHCLALLQQQASELLVSIARNGKPDRTQLIALARMGEIVASLQAACNVTPVQP